MTATMMVAVVMFIGTAPPLALPPLAVGTGGREQGRRPQLKEPREGSYHHQSKRRSEGATGFVCTVCVVWSTLYSSVAARSNFSLPHGSEQSSSTCISLPSRERRKGLIARLRT